MSRWENLANAIVEQAVRDYMDAPVRPNVTEEEAELCKPEKIEEFFNSRWFGVISSLDGEELFQKVKMMKRAEDRKRQSAVRAAA